MQRGRNDSIKSPGARERERFQAFQSAPKRNASALTSPGEKQWISPVGWMTWNHVPPLPSFLAVAWRASSLNFGYIHRERFAVVVTGLRFNCHSPSSILCLSLRLRLCLSCSLARMLFLPLPSAMFVPRASRSGRRIVSLSFEIKFAAPPRVILRKISLYGVIKSPIWNVVVVVLGIIL